MTPEDARLNHLLEALDAKHANPRQLLRCFVDDLHQTHAEKTATPCRPLSYLHAKGLRNEVHRRLSAALTDPEILQRFSSLLLVLSHPRTAEMAWDHAKGILKQFVDSSVVHFGRDTWPKLYEIVKGDDVLIAGLLPMAKMWSRDVRAPVAASTPTPIAIPPSHTSLLPARKPLVQKRWGRKPPPPVITVRPGSGTLANTKPLVTPVIRTDSTATTTTTNPTATTATTMAFAPAPITTLPSIRTTPITYTFATEAGRVSSGGATTSARAASTNTTVWLTRASSSSTPVSSSHAASSTCMTTSASLSAADVSTVTPLSTLGTANKSRVISSAMAVLAEAAGQAVQTVSVPGQPYRTTYDGTAAAGAQSAGPVYYITAPTQTTLTTTPFAGVCPDQTTLTTTPFAGSGQVMNLETLTTNQMAAPQVYYHPSIMSAMGGTMQVLSGAGLLDTSSMPPGSVIVLQPNSMDMMPSSISAPELRLHNALTSTSASAPFSFQGGQFMQLQQPTGNLAPMSISSSGTPAGGPLVINYLMQGGNLMQGGHTVGNV